MNLREILGFHCIVNSFHVVADKLANMLHQRFQKRHAKSLATRRDRINSSRMHVNVSECAARPAIRINHGASRDPDDPSSIDHSKPLHINESQHVTTDAMQDLQYQFILVNFHLDTVTVGRAAVRSGSRPPARPQRRRHRNCVIIILAYP